MIWEEIKRAINSTLGTPTFTPLNKLVVESRILQKNSSDLYKTLVSADTYSTVIFDTNEGVVSKSFPNTTFKSYLSGELCFHASLTCYKTSIDYYFDVYVNGTKTQSVTLGGGAGNKSYTIDLDLPITAYDKFEFKVRSSGVTTTGFTFSMTDARLMGKYLDTTGFVVLEG